MSHRVATSRLWLVAFVLANGCGDDMQDTPSQKAAGSSARGAAETAGATAKAGSAAPEAESGGAGSAAGGGGGSGGGSAGASSAPPMDDGKPTFTNLYNVVFWSCTNPSCHGGGLAGLNFATKDAAWATLVGKPANPMYECAKLGKQRVVAGEPDNSLLYLKLDIDAPCGQQMPPGGSLSDAARERVRQWIMMGAKND